MLSQVCCAESRRSETPLDALVSAAGLVRDTAASTPFPANSTLYVDIYNFWRFFLLADASSFSKERTDCHT